MKVRNTVVALALAALPRLLAAQAAAAAPAAPASTSPVADAFRQQEQRQARNLVAAAEVMPAEKFNYRPTPAQMSWAMIQTHLAEGNDLFCSKIGGVAAPKRTPVDTTASKDQLVARLKETFAFCDTALAKLDDSKLAEPLNLGFGPNPFSRAFTIMITVGDWQDHYSQESNYLRLNGLLPPTARRGM
ncbi:MAG TPA: DinB family protein [Gemmatimonadales bacterium]|nr:DinB family protein [Gemmatimonadales bacterium]